MGRRAWSVVFPALALLAGCVPVPRSCTRDAHCEAGEVCDRDRLRCEPGPGAGGGAAGGEGGVDAGPDADACLAGNGGCGDAAICTSLPGGRACACAPGFAGDGGTCLYDDASLASLRLELEGPVPLAFDFDPAAAEQRVLWPSESSARLRVTPAVANPAGVALSVDDQYVESAGTRTVELLALPATVRVRATARSGRFRDVLLRVGSDFRHRAYLKASSPGGEAPSFGAAVALSADGSTLAVGAMGEAGSATGGPLDTSAPAAGAVVVFVRDLNGSWVPQARLKASNARARALFGAAVALSADGATLVVGSRGESSRAPGVDGDQADTGAFEAGAAYVFVRSGDAGWSQQAYLKASRPAPLDWFGNAVAIDAAGDTVLVGAPGESGCGPGPDGDASDGGCPGSGAAFLFSRAGATWTARARVKAPNPGAGDAFGLTLALAPDAGTFAVSAVSEASGAVGVGGDQADDSAPDRGAVYVFSGGAAGWALQGYLKAPVAGPGGLLGSSLALGGGGSVLAASFLDTPSSGAVVVYRRTGDAWAVEATLQPSFRANQGAFGLAWSPGLGAALALGAGGDTLVVGDPAEQGGARGVGGDPAAGPLPGSGAAFVFRRAAGRWAQAVYLKAPLPHRGDGLGNAVALAADGRTLAVGTPDDASASLWPGSDSSDTSAPHRGAVHVYQW